MRRRKIFRFFDRYFGIPILILLAIFTRKKRRLPVEDIRNILFIKLAAIGDAILLVPTLRKLKEAFPDAKLTFMCSDINRMVIEKIPYVDSIINCRVYDFLKNPFHFIYFIKNLRKTKYEVIIDAGQWERINSVIVCFANKDYSIGFRTKRQLKHIINDAVVDHLKNKHEVENFMDLLIPLGIIPAGRKLTFDELQLEYFLKEADREFRRKFWSENKLLDSKVICFHPGCGENGKPREWEVENYIALGRKLSAIDSSLRIIITGTKKEYILCEKIYQSLKDIAINTAGMFTLEQSAALVENSLLMICSNTGMLHISTSVGTRTIGLHGPTNPEKWGAYSPWAIPVLSDKFCSPCLYLGHDYGCNKPSCMKHISIEHVFSAVVKVLYPHLINKLSNK